MEQSAFPSDAGRETPTQRGLMKPLMLELVPFFSFVVGLIFAIVVFRLRTDSFLGYVPLLFSVLVGVSGLGWLCVGESRWGWTILIGRLIIVMAGFVMGFWVIGSALGAGLCECEPHHLVALTPAFEWAAGAVWVVALVSPVVSSVMLASWVHRHRTSHA